MKQLSTDITNLLTLPLWQGPRQHLHSLKPNGNRRTQSQLDSSSKAEETILWIQVTI